MKKYLPTIGIEIHAQLSTKSKMFCGCDNNSRESDPNTNICPVCIALPGTLPAVNKAAVEMAIKLAKAFNAKVPELTSFDRKNYFYPDSPKGYQITQMEQPIIQSGFVEILVDNEFKKIGIHHAHLEEDAGKLTHPEGKDYSLVDFNRAGTPLLEIVSEPDIKSAEEAKRYLQEIYNIVTAIGICDGDMEHGNFKFDLNISVSDSDEFGTKVELKNLNSFRNAERALNYEIERQIAELESGGAIDQETRGWNDAKGLTFSQRGKEEAHDYRYFPEPDIPPLSLPESLVDVIQKDIGVLPIEARKKLHGLGVSLEDQDLLISNARMLEIFEEASKYITKQNLNKKIINWLVGDYQALVVNKADGLNLSGKDLAELINMIEAAEISSKIAKDIFDKVARGASPKALIKEMGIEQVSDETELESIIVKLIDQNQKAKDDYKDGSEKVVGYFVGQVMKETRGQANPAKVNELVIKLLKE